VCLQGESKSLAEMVVEAGYAEVSLPSYAPKTPVGGDAEGTDKKVRYKKIALLDFLKFRKKSWRVGASPE